MAAPAPVLANINYQLQPHVKLTRENWAIFEAAFGNYATQQGFFEALEAGDVAPAKMAQATHALTSGWVDNRVLSLFRHTASDNAYDIWTRMQQFYGRNSDIRKMSLRDRAERYKQGPNESMQQFLGNLNDRVSDLEATGFQCDATHRKQLVRFNCNSKYKAIVFQILLSDPGANYSQFMMTLLEAVVDGKERERDTQSQSQPYFSSRGRSTNRGRQNYRGRHLN